MTHRNEIRSLFRQVFREQKSDEGELLICYAETLLVELSKRDLPRFLEILKDFDISYDLQDILSWWEDNE